MHKIIFRGQVLDGHDRDTVREKLGQLFHIEDTARLDSLFTGKAVTIKKSLDEASARKYLTALEKAGALVELEPPLLERQTTAEPLADFTDFPESSGQDLSFNTVMQSFNDDASLASEASSTEENTEADSAATNTATEDDASIARSWWPLAAGAGAALVVAAGFIFWPDGTDVKKHTTAPASATTAAALSADKQAQLESLFAIAAEGSDVEFNQALSEAPDAETRQAMHELRELSAAQQ